MKRLLRWFIFFFAATLAPAQSKAPIVPAVTAPSAPPILVIPDTQRIKIRDAQLDWDELEVENQKALLKVEQNKAKQIELMASIRKVAFEFAQKAQIDLAQYELDPHTLEFVRKTNKGK